MKQKHSYSIIFESIVIIRFSEPPQSADIISAVDEISSLDKTGFRIWDLSNGFNIATDLIIELARYTRSKWPHTAKVAFIAPDNLSFGNLRMFSTFRQQEGEEFMVFRTEEDAISYIKKFL